MNKDEALKKAKEAIDTAPKKEKVIKIADIKSLIENLTIQYNKYTAEYQNNQTMAIKTQGAIEVANAQLQGLEDDPKPAN